LWCGDKDGLRFIIKNMICGMLAGKFCRSVGEQATRAVGVAGAWGVGEGKNKKVMK
jgi:uncharacterized membrane protein YeaQ/YmgE (transglycosylase-associated protein family)